MWTRLYKRSPCLYVYGTAPDAAQSGIPRLCQRLGVSTAEAVDLVARIPVVLSLDERLLNLQVWCV
jgi:hypothetical protein